MKLLSFFLSLFLYCLFSTTSLAAEATNAVVNTAVNTVTNAVAASSAASTVTHTAVNSAPGNLLQIIVSLIIVVGLLIAFAVAFKKFGLNRLHSAFPVKIIGSISVGNNQRIMMIEAGEEWIVLGVTPQNISTITSMPRQEKNNSGNSDSANNSINQSNFSTWMQNALEKYRVKKP